mmetsp:Transcript_133089/g.332219  ORF Transcript_133089/g.332219 Transcript_133089/m.332219 type:complete len:187 (-) Transcript_133089:90-650(-)
MAGRGPPDITGMTSLKVDCAGALPDKWNAEDLRALFEKYGEVGDVFIPREKYSERSRPFAFVRFPLEADAREAIKQMNGYKLQGSMLTVSKANRSREMARSENAQNDYRPRRPPSRSPRRSRSRSPPPRRGRSRSPSMKRQRYRSPSSPRQVRQRAASSDSEDNHRRRRRSNSRRDDSRQRSRRRR